MQSLCANLTSTCLRSEAEPCSLNYVLMTFRCLQQGGYNTNKPELCPLCMAKPETRQHFVVSCPALQNVREIHWHRLPTLRQTNERETTTFQHLLLYRPSRDIAVYAPSLGHFIADLWHERWKLRVVKDRTTPYIPRYP